jgi:formamidopyrimidine-DNA glycosylase
MPELPEVEVVARQLSDRVEGRTVSKVIVRRPDVLHGDPRPLPDLLHERRIISVSRRGKRIQIDADGGVRLIVHLGMSGELAVCKSNSPLDRHVHLRLALADSDLEVRFRDPRRFGGVWRLTPETTQWKGRRLAELGYEPLELNADTFRQILKRGRQVKALLMDQRLIAGLGNIYCDESLHRASIHPRRLAESIPARRADLLLSAIKEILEDAIRAGGSTIRTYRRVDGSNGRFQESHLVYGREGQRCVGCNRGIIRRETIAGRSTHYCPVCQRLGRRNR